MNFAFDHVEDNAIVALDGNEVESVSGAGLYGGVCVTKVVVVSSHYGGGKGGKGGHCGGGKGGRHRRGRGHGHGHGGHGGCNPCN